MFPIFIPTKKGGGGEKHPRVKAGWGLLSEHVGGETMLHVNPLVVGPKTWRGAWHCAFTGAGLFVGRGSVNGQEWEGDEITGKIKVGEGEKKWVVLMVFVNEKGAMEKDGIEVGIGKEPKTHDPSNLGVHPLAMLRGTDSGIELLQLAFFDLMHYTRKDARSGRMRHYFAPV